jgi:hypothetical protein
VGGRRGDELSESAGGRRDGEDGEFGELGESAGGRRDGEDGEFGELSE